MSLNTILATAPLTTTNYILKATGTTIGNSLIWDNGTNVGIGNTNTSYTLDVSGTGRFSGNTVLGGSLTSFGITGSTFSIYPASSANLNLLQNYNGTTYTTEEHRASDYSYKIGTTAAMTITSAGLTTFSAFGTHSFSSAGTGYNKLTIRNTTAGTGNGSQLSIGVDTDADQLYIQSFSSTFTTSGMNIAAGAVINGEGAGGLSIAATQSNIGFYTNGASASNLRMLIKANGVISIIGPSATNPTNLSLSVLTSTGNNDTLRISTSLENDGKLSVEILKGTSNRAVYSDSTGLLTNTSSDVTLKSLVENITYGLNSVISLRPVFYNWIPENLGPQKEIGFIAQEVQEIIPEVIGINSDDTLSLDYPKLTAVLVKAIQEQQIQIQNLQEQNQDLKSRLDKAGL